MKSRIDESKGNRAYTEVEVRTRLAALSPEQMRLLSNKIKGIKGDLLLRQIETTSHSPLIAIRSGGAKRPLFMADPAGGSAKAYGDLIKYLDPEQPLYAFQRLVLGADAPPPYLSLDRLAANYIEALQTVQAEGPYLIGGYSMGGVVAFEMAIQLKALGQEVALVALIDSAAPSVIAEDEERPHSLRDDLLLIGAILASAEGTEFNLSPAALDSLTPDEQLDRFAGQVWKQGLTPVYIYPAMWRAVTVTLRHSRRAVRNYSPRAYDGQVLLIKADSDQSDPTVVWQRPPTEHLLGWDAFCVKPITVCLVPADHIRLMAEPHIRTVGEMLQRALDQLPAGG